MVKWSPGLFPGIKWPGYDINHSLSPTATVKERVALCLYSPLGLHVLFEKEIYFFIYFLQTQSRYTAYL